MPGSIGGLRYYRLLLGGGITSSELNTELADANNLGALSIMLEMNYYRAKLLSPSSVAYPIIFGSEIAKYTFLLTNAYWYSLTSGWLIQTMDFASETVTAKAAHTERIWGATHDRAGLKIYGNALASGTTKRLYEFDYVGNTNSLHGSTLTYQQQDNAAFTADAEQYGGYVGGLYSGSTYISNMSRFSFASETSSGVTSVLSSTRAYLACGSDDDAAYTFGGTNGGGGAAVSAVDKITKVANTASTIADTLAAARWTMLASQSATHAYAFSGYDSAGAEKTTIEKMDFATETINAVGTSLAVASKGGGATNGNNKIYYGGHYTGSYPTDIRTIDTSADTVSTATGVLDTSQNNTAGIGCCTAGGQ